MLSSVHKVQRIEPQQKVLCRKLALHFTSLAGRHIVRTTHLSAAEWSAMVNCFPAGSRQSTLFSFKPKGTQSIYINIKDFLKFAKPRGSAPPPEVPELIKEREQIFPLSNKL